MCGGRRTDLAIRIRALFLISYRIKRLLSKSNPLSFKNLNPLRVLIYNYSLALYSSPYRVSLIFLPTSSSRTKRPLRSFIATFFATILNSSLK